MIYIGEQLNPSLLEKLNKAFIVVGVTFGLAVATLAVASWMEKGKSASLSEQIASQTKAVADAQTLAKDAEKNPVVDVPKGMAAVAAFQTRLQKLAKEHQCSIAQFQSSDQAVPYISSFVTGAQASGSWTQVEVKLNLQGTTRSVTETLRDMASLEIPYEFTSVEISRSQASAMGEATVTANVSLRVLTIPGGA